MNEFWKEVAKNMKKARSKKPYLILGGLSIAGLLTIAIISVLGLTTVSYADPGQNIYYVASYGSDSNPGTIDSPWKTIQKAADTLIAGQTVYVRAGTYNEQVTISKSGTADNPITISAYPGKSPVITDTRPYKTTNFYDPRVYITGNYIVFDGFEIKNSIGRGIQTYQGEYNTLRNLNVHHSWENGILLLSNHNIVEDCKVWQNVQVNNPGGTAEFYWSSGLSAANDANYNIIRRNEVFNNFGEGLSVLKAGYATLEDNVTYDNWACQLYLDNANDVLVQRNLIYATDDSEFFRGGQPSPGLAIADEEYGSRPSTGRNLVIINNIVVRTSDNLCYWKVHPDSGLKNSVIAHNTLFENQGDGAAMDISSGKHSNTRIKNNIVFQSSGSLVSVPDDPELMFSHNLWSRPVSGRPSSPNDVIGDPKLVNPYAQRNPGAVSPNWYKLTSSSPTINQAKVISEVIEDFFGNTRGSKPDIGAHEYIGEAPPEPTCLERGISRRLQKLFHHRFLDRPRSQIIDPLGGTQKMVYALGDKGADLLAEKFGIDRGKIKWGEKNREVKDRHIQHTLMISNFRVCLET